MPDADALDDTGRPVLDLGVGLGQDLDDVLDTFSELVELELDDLTSER